MAIPFNEVIYFYPETLPITPIMSDGKPATVSVSLQENTFDENGSVIGSVFKLEVNPSRKVTGFIPQGAIIKFGNVRIFAPIDISFTAGETRFFLETFEVALSGRLDPVAIFIPPSLSNAWAQLITNLFANQVLTDGAFTLAPNVLLPSGILAWLPDDDPNTTDPLELMLRQGSANTATYRLSRQRYAFQFAKLIPDIPSLIDDPAAGFAPVAGFSPGRARTFIGYRTPANVTVTSSRIVTGAVDQVKSEIFPAQQIPMFARRVEWQTNEAIDLTGEGGLQQSIHRAVYEVEAGLVQPDAIGIVSDKDGFIWDVIGVERQQTGNRLNLILTADRAN